MGLRIALDTMCGWQADLTQLHTGLRRVPEHVVEQLCLSLEQALFHGLYTQVRGGACERAGRGD